MKELTSSGNEDGQLLRGWKFDFDWSVLQEYLRALHELHEEWLVRKTAFSCPANVLVLEADEDLQTMNDVFRERRKEIMCGYS